MVSNGTSFDAFVAERRIRALWELPWVLPATVVIGMTDEDLDLLYAARDKDEYWRLLRNIVERLERGWREGRVTSRDNTEQKRISGLARLDRGYALHHRPAQEACGVTVRRNERDRERRKRRKAREAAERLREERKRRFEELSEAWRRNHPSEEEERKGGPKRGRPA
jgi:hypothetical protein